MSHCVKTTLTKADRRTRVAAHPWRIGDRITFAEEKRAYTIRAKSTRFLVCTKPHFGTVLYTIVDLWERVRGTDGFVLGLGYETPRDCRKALVWFREAVRDEGHSISHRNRIPLKVMKK
jgi:hypothetical protein